MKLAKALNNRSPFLNQPQIFQVLKFPPLPGRNFRVSSLFLCHSFSFPLHLSHLLQNSSSPSSSSRPQFLKFFSNATPGRFFLPSRFPNPNPSHHHLSNFELPTPLSFNRFVAILPRFSKLKLSFACLLSLSFSF